MLARFRSRLSPASPALAIAAVAAACAVFAGACSASNEGGDSQFTGASTAGPGTGGGSSGGAGPGSGAGAPGGNGAFAGGAGPGSGGGPDDCTEAAKLVYVIGQDNQLLSFDPPTTTFAPVGYISCPNAGFGTPFSMAVARNGTAYVLFSDGQLYLVDTSNAACTASSYVPNQAFLTFGMGFVSDTPESEQETLYVADYVGTGIGKIDLATMQLQVVGNYSGGLTGAAELTGTGDARLFGFFTGTPIVIAEIDKSNAAILSQAPQPTVNIGSGWAFAFWGGDFWLFTSPNGLSSQVDRYQPSTGTTTTVKMNAGTNIVGAGVSTCAPVEPPS